MENSYSRYRGELAEKLFIRFNKEDVDYILNSVDYISGSFDIVNKGNEIIKSDDSIPYYCRLYLVAKKLEGAANSTMYSLETTLRSFFSIVHKSPENVVPNDIRYYIFLYKKEGKISDSSLEVSRRIIYGFFKWCVNEGHLTRNPAENVDKLKITPNPPREPLNLMEIELMRKACLTLREKAIFETFYSTGCRVAELVGLKKSDINLQNRTVHLFGKGRKHRTSFLNAKSIISLSDYLESRNDDNEYVFVSERGCKNLSTKAVQGIISEIARRSGIGRKVSPHILRHTMATVALSNGMAIEEISTILGHASIETTMIYAKINMEDLKIKHSKCIV